jgi:hypothetical protein
MRRRHLLAIGDSPNVIIIPIFPPSAFSQNLKAAAQFPLKFRYGLSCTIFSFDLST